MERVPESESIAELQDARRFNEVMGKGLVQGEYRRFAQEICALEIPLGGRILDLGTGTGFVALEIAARLDGRARVTGLDLSSAMLSLAAENARQRGLEQVVDWRLGDAAAMPFEDHEFDVVVSSGSLHHWEDPRAIFDEIARVIRPGGRYVLRDSKRLSRAPARFAAWAIGMTLPADFRVHYWGSIRSSYLRPELEEILAGSRLQDWKVVEDFFDLAITNRDS